jgi:hypothetical protein
VWINGENFLTMKKEGLLFGPFAEQLPIYRWVGTVGKPTTRTNFSEPVDGLEAPWGMAQLTFFADRNRKRCAAAGRRSRERAARGTPCACAPARSTSTMAARCRSTCAGGRAALLHRAGSRRAVWRWMPMASCA